MLLDTGYRAGRASAGDEPRFADVIGQYPQVGPILA